MAMVRTRRLGLGYAARPQGGVLPRGLSGFDVLYVCPASKRGILRDAWLLPVGAGAAAAGALSISVPGASDYYFWTGDLDPANPTHLVTDVVVNAGEEIRLWFDPALTTWCTYALSGAELDV